jgi:hypothetical protein
MGRRAIAVCAPSGRMRAPLANGGPIQRRAAIQSDRSVTAPLLAVDTSFMYLAMSPRL